MGFRLRRGSGRGFKKGLGAWGIALNSLGYGSA